MDYIFGVDGTLRQRRRHGFTDLRASYGSDGAVFAQTGRGDGQHVPVSVRESTYWLLHTDL